MPLRSVSAAYLAQAGDLAGNPGQQAAYDSTGNCVVLAAQPAEEGNIAFAALADRLDQDPGELGRDLCGEAVSAGDILQHGAQRCILPALLAAIADGAGEIRRAGADGDLIRRAGVGHIVHLEAALVDEARLHIAALLPADLNL